MRQTSRGFTLTEILLAMLIASILVLGISAAYQQAHRVWVRTEQNRPLYADARMIVETLRTELSCLYMPPVEEDQEKVFVLATEPDGRIEMVFYTQAPGYLSAVGAGRIAKVRYCFDRDPQTGETALLRSEQECAGEKVIGQEVSSVMAKRLASFKLWSYVPAGSSGDADWRQSYASAEQAPKAIRVTFKWAADQSVPDKEFTTAIVVPCQASLQHP
ncbi:MAG TPA: prepilin-type N-terminal cleavage/methylation domain-containing protein [Anaerohalosphaeraceae bacterium]|jgi:prepilin-type N-terminal cleavage/methylation domain-containing protein|nr:prepilin-type N-terminal cleavage/methylation domain-containing protein [Anaerohalosphaeraceae bacterium]